MILQILGTLSFLSGLFIIIFKNSFSRSHFITVPAGFGGKSFQEKFGKDKGSNYMALFGLIFVILGIILIIAGIFNLNLSY